MMFKMLADMVKDIVLHQEAMLDLMVEKKLLSQEDIKRLFVLKARRLSQMDQMQTGVSNLLAEILNDPNMDNLSDEELMNKLKSSIPVPTDLAGSETSFDPPAEPNFEDDDSEFDIG